PTPEPIVIAAPRMTSSSPLPTAARTKLLSLMAAASATAEEALKAISPVTMPRRTMRIPVVREAFLLDNARPARTPVAAPAIRVSTPSPSVPPTMIVPKMLRTDTQGRRDHRMIAAPATKAKMRGVLAGYSLDIGLLATRTTAASGCPQFGHAVAESDT